jgi:hypothetical protein
VAAVRAVARREAHSISMADLIYEVSFKGAASETLRAAFTDYDLSVSAGVTLVRCSRDALRSLMTRIEELGLELLDVRLVADQPSSDPPRREAEGRGA